jgi:O-antigen/teichoic acid export membrane protein
MNIAKGLFRSSVARVGLTVVSTVISFFMLPFLVGKLGDTWYGVWTIIASLTGYYYLADVGLTSAVTRHVAKFIARRDSDGANKIINTSLLIYSLLGLVIFAASLGISACANLFVDNLQDLFIVRAVIMITALNIAIEFPYKAFSGIIGAYIRYDLLTYSHFLTIVISTGLTVFYLSRGHGIVSLAVIGFGSAQISNVLFYAISRRLFPNMQLGLRHVNRRTIRDLFGYSVWSFVIQIGDQLRLRISAFMIGLMLSAGNVTHFYIGARLVEMFINLVYRATNIMTPVFTKYHAENNYDEIRSKLLLMTKINTVIAVFGGGMIILLGRPFLQRWMGNDYLDAYPVMVTLMVPTILEIIVNPAANVIYAVAKHRQLSIVSIGEGAANVLLSLVFIRFYGIWGAALAMAVPISLSRVIFIPMIVCRSAGMELRDYYAMIMKSAAFGMAYLFLAYLVTRELPIAPHYASLIAVTLVLSPLYLLGALFLSFDSQDRARFRELLAS